MSFWMAGSSQAARTELSETSVFTRQIPIYWVHQQVAEFSPQCWQTQLLRPLCNNNESLKRGWEKDCNDSIWSLLASNKNNLVLCLRCCSWQLSSPAWLYSAKPPSPEQQSPAFLSCSREKWSCDLSGKMCLSITEDLLESHVENIRIAMHLCATQKLLGCFL